MVQGIGPISQKIRKINEMIVSCATFGMDRKTETLELWTQQKADQYRQAELRHR